LLGGVHRKSGFYLEVRALDFKMYNNKERIQKELDSFKLGFCGKLDPENRWILLSGLIPWELLEPLYQHQFNNRGRPAKRFRVALGSLIIQETLGVSDRELVIQISENPYMQFFLGFPSFETKIPFDSSLLVYFRKRINWKNIAQINDLIAAQCPNDEVPETNSGTIDKNDDDPENGQAIEETCLPHNEPVEGTLILDATCIPADIRYPQDLSLLDEARRKTETIIDVLHKSVGGKKPRTYRIAARKQFLAVIRKRKKEPKQMQKAIGKQLQYVGRNLRAIKDLMDNYRQQQGQGSLLSVLSNAEYKALLVVHELYRQQLELKGKKKRSIPDRIVSIRQPHIRPIIRGKARSDVEFGAKVSVACFNGFIFVDRISFDAYSESKDIPLQVEAYRLRTGHYPERILADKAYQNRENRQWCKERGIRLMGVKQGRSFEDPYISRLFRKLERIEEIERVEIEGRIGIQKRRYNWNTVKGRLPETAMTMIMLAVLAANLTKRMSDILFYLFQAMFTNCITLKKLLPCLPVTENCACNLI